jgi:hypothetical protein
MVKRHYGNGIIMLAFTAILLVLVGAMHSVLGGRNLISPLLAREDFPIVLGSQRNGRLTLWFGWHALTLFWWAQAYVLWRMADDMTHAGQATLISWATACALIGLIALIVSKGKHLSWVFFLPVATLLFIAGMGS